MLAALIASLLLQHISLERGGTHKSRYGDAAIKETPCGKKGGARGENVYRYRPGQTITVKLVEYVSHPGYFRIAFDADGDDAFIDPASIKPVDPNRKCPSSQTDRCGESDFYNSEAVLPGMDNLDPHLRNLLDAPTRSWEVTLPDVECDNCTLQIVQVMEDDDFHGPYDPTPGVGVADLYFQCIDLVLTRTGEVSEEATPKQGGCQSAPAGWAAVFVLVVLRRCFLRRRVVRTTE
jgi:hypothetical protein